MTSYLDRVSRKAPSSEGLSCVALVHNEAHILNEFLAHYRAIGVRQFLIVDDRSTDGSHDILMQAPDVTVFTPKEGSHYKDHKRFWRAELLDTFCTGTWTVVPDVDEHLVFADSPNRDLSSLTADLDAQGAQAAAATMVDMYRADVLTAPAYAGDGLLRTYPLFDGPDHYFRLLNPRRFRAKYATPPFMIIGGMKQRFFEPLDLYSGWTGATFRRLSDVAGPLTLTGTDALTAPLARALVRRRLAGRRVFNLMKVPLVKWQRGSVYYNGAHAIDRPMPLARERLALLHFNLAGGQSAIRYRVERGQHAEGAAYYKRMLERSADSTDTADQGVVFDGTLTYRDPASLGRLIGPV